jgi:tRNA(Ile)-lysidine synthase
VPNEKRSLSYSEFDLLMKRFDPFEDRPKLAVAVSGGSDSLALALLTQNWVKNRQGSLTALTVNHGLRPDSLKEAQKVGECLKKYSIPHVILSWGGSKPKTGIQEAARCARYHLLEEWCRESGCLHLLLGHQQEDQAETVLFRLRGHSSLIGLAGMSAVLEKPHLRIIRPFLSIPKDRLQACLKERKQEWIEDPSNQDAQFQRARLRMQRLEVKDWDVLRYHALVQKYRQTSESLQNFLFSQMASISPLGFLTLKRAPFLELPVDFQRALLLCTLKTIGVGLYPPKSVALNNTLFRMLHPGFTGTTCYGAFIKRYHDQFLVMREHHRVKDQIDLNSLTQQDQIQFDQRFEVNIHALRHRLPSRNLIIRKIGQDGWKQLLLVRPQLKEISIPKTALWSLPAAWLGSKILLDCNVIDEWCISSVKKRKSKEFIFKPRYPFSCFIFLGSS